jgi:hypothetical protein
MFIIIIIPTTTTMQRALGLAVVPFTHIVHHLGVVAIVWLWLGTHL